MARWTLRHRAFREQPHDREATDAAARFTPLFNGRNLDGWKGLVGNPRIRAEMSAAELSKSQQQADEEVHRHWKVEDGVIVFDGQGENLCTAKDYRNIVLLVDFKTHEKGDSGIYLRGTPQVQMWDSNLNNIGSGGPYNNIKSRSTRLELADHSAGQWNSFRIEMIDDKVTVDDLIQSRIRRRRPARCSSRVQVAVASSVMNWELQNPHPPDASFPWNRSQERYSSRRI